MPYMPYHRRKAPTLLDEEALDRALQEKTSHKDDNTDSTQIREETDESDTKPKPSSRPLHASFSKVVLLDEDALLVAWKAKEKRRQDEHETRSRRHLVQHQVDHHIDNGGEPVQAPGRPPRRRRFFLGPARPPKLFTSRHSPDDASRETHQLSLATPSTPSPDHGHQRPSDRSLTSRPQSQKLITVTPILKKNPLLPQAPQPHLPPPKSPVQVPEHKVQDMKSILESRLVLKTPIERDEHDLHQKSIQIADNLPQDIHSEDPEMERPTEKDVQKQSDVIQSMKSLFVSGVALKPTKKSPSQQQDTPDTSTEQLRPPKSQSSPPQVDEPQSVLHDMKNFLESGASLKSTPKQEMESSRKITSPPRGPKAVENPVPVATPNDEAVRPAPSGVQSMRQLFESRSTPAAKVTPAWAKKLANSNKTPEAPANTTAPVPQTLQTPHTNQHDDTKTPKSSASRRSKSSAVSSASPKKRVVRIMKVRKKNGEIVERVMDDSTNESNVSPVSRRVVVVKKKNRPKGSKPSSHRTSETGRTAQRSQTPTSKNAPRPIAAPVRGKKHSRKGSETVSTAMRSSDTVSTLGDPSEVVPISSQSLNVPSSLHSTKSSNPRGPTSWTIRNTPTSGFQPNQHMDPEIVEYYAENLGGVEIVSNTSRIFFYKALSDPDLHEHFKDIRWEDMRNEFIVLANLEVPDQFDERLRSVVQHHCTLMESGADMNRVMSTWESAVEESWKENSAADPRQLIVGPSRVIFNLKAIERHFAMYRRERQAERRAQNQRALQRRRGGILARLVKSNDY
eukprot:Nitzschia sp. Nitz4//scaffold6_size259037//13033//15405//NITZ4_001040-RA/size259037-processed-gene-0.240-mRNA-1//-1//CDS//3329556791//7876//frame0